MLLRISAGLSLRISTFDLRIVWAKFVVDKTAIGQVFLHKLQFSPLRIIPRKLYTHLNPLSTKLYLSDLKTHFVLRSKHSIGYTNQSVNAV